LSLTSRRIVAIIRFCIDDFYIPLCGQSATAGTEAKIISIYLQEKFLQTANILSKRDNSLSKVVFMKKYILLLLVALVLYATNPTQAEFNEYARVFVQDKVTQTGQASDNLLERIIGTLTGKAAKAASDTLIDRKDYYLFSVYTLQGLNYNYRFIGVGKKFFQIGQTTE
jgi:hypothetical protein